MSINDLAREFKTNRRSVALLVMDQEMRVRLSSGDLDCMGIEVKADEDTGIVRRYWITQKSVN